jgi:trk system potassium uptake protein TrkA
LLNGGDILKIIIAGGGKVGATLIKQLSAEGYDLTLIDSSHSVLESTLEKYDVLAVTGNCAAMDTLLQADIKDADLLIAATSADEINLLCCMTAHGLNPGLHTIARIRNPEYIDQTYKMRNFFALSLAVNPEKQAAMEIERLLKFPGFLKRETFAKGRVEIVELKIEAGSKLCNIPLYEMSSIVRCKVLVCTVLRDGTAAAPDGNFILREGDRIFVTAPTNNLAILLKNLGVITRRVNRIIICGGGRVSYYLAQLLIKSGITVQIIEKDYDKCIQLANALPNASVIHGDASDQTLLESEGISDCSAVASLTGLDELNIIISLYGNSCGVPQIITKLGHFNGSRITDSLPIGSIISPKELCANNIVRYVRAMQNHSGAAISVHSIADGQFEASEFMVDSKTPHCGELLKNIKLRKNILIACIIHGSKTEIPSGDSSFTAGDTIIVVSGNNVIHNLNEIFA